MTTILIVDDEASLRDMLGIVLRKEGFVVVTADSRSSAARLLSTQSVDLVLTDLRLPDGDGIEILRHVKAASPETFVIVMTAFGSTETAVAALKLGAHDYLMKPFDIEELKIVIRNALERQDLKQEVRLLKAELHAQNAVDRIVGRSAAMASVIATVRAVAATNSTVLLTGESGTGKEVLAKAIHDASPRRERPFVSINCGALPEHLLESEMFGHVRGAFTDAHQNKKGLFEAAHNGTLFLDEVGEMPVSMQVKLLRALQERRIRRVGGTDEIEVDVRIVGATNRSLETMIEDGRFREDLYYRLNVIPIRVPPLRERAEDVPLLVEHLGKQLAERMGKKVPLIPPAEMLTLERYPWPGNVRELENVMERALALGVSPASLTDVSRRPTTSASPAGALALGGGFDLDAHLHAEEERLLKQALAQADGDRSIAARLLGVNARGLRYLLSKHPAAENS
jgi:two-component system, NtrC family, response regulator PilR